jgi:ATP/maltotriose-dependent transcriptional regulator MalT
MDVARERGDVDKALSYAFTASRIAGVNNKPGLYQVMSDIYRGKKDYVTALNYKDSVVIYSDSLTSLKNKQLTDNCLTKIEILKMRSETDREMARLNQHKNIYIFLLCIAVMIMVFTLITIRNQRIRNRQDKMLMNLKLEQQHKERLLVERQMKESELVAEYQQEMMRRSLEEKSKALSASTMFISSRNALIEDIIKSLSDNADKPAQHALEESVQHLRQLLRTSNEHDNFLIEFESANPEFIAKLKKMHPDLLASDVRFLAYIHMGLSNKEIASLLNITPDSCKRRKIRISQKLGLESASDLYGYLTN